MSVGVENTMTLRRIASAPRRRLILPTLLVTASVVLVATSAYRAATSSFTHDESLSFAIFNWAPQWGGTANNHLLNTRLMRLCSWLFGNSELSLRMPNVAAHVIYLGSTLLLLKRLKQPLIQVLGFVLLALNPYILDFFSLARGYGLGLACLMLSLYLLMRAHEEKPAGRPAIYGFLSLLSAALAVLANFSFLTYYLPMVLVAAWVLASDLSYRRFSRDRLVIAAGLLGAGALLAVFPLHRLLLLRRTGQLYFGGDTGFFSDTFEGLVRASAYSRSLSRPTTTAISVILVGMVLVALAVGAWRFLRHAEPSLALVFSVLFAGSVVFAIVEHYLFHVLWPIERAAVSYIPLYVVAVLFGAQLLTELTHRWWRLTAILALPALMAVLLCSQFVRHFDPYSYLDWAYDRHDKDAIGLVARDCAVTKRCSTVVRLGDSWEMEPSLNFYRVTLGYTQVAPVTRDPVTKGHYDYVYGFHPDVAQLRGQTIRLASYSDTNTVLVRVKR